MTSHNIMVRIGLCLAWIHSVQPACCAGEDLNSAQNLSPTQAHTTMTQLNTSIRWFAFFVLLLLTRSTFRSGIVVL